MSISLKTWFRGPGNHSNTQIQGFIEGKMAPTRDRRGLEDRTGLNSNPAFCSGDTDTASLSLSSPSVK